MFADNQVDAAKHRLQSGEHRTKINSIKLFAASSFIETKKLYNFNLNVQTKRKIYCKYNRY